MLLHLCIHAAYDDRFGGGPLILFDIDFLLRQIRELDCVGIDWPRFWAAPASGGWLRGCAQLLRLQQQLFVTPGLQWPHPDPSAALLAEVIRGLGSLLLLGDTVLGREGRMSKESDAAGGLAQALRHWFASPEKVATLFAVLADSWCVYGYYSRYWWRLLASRLPAYITARRAPGVVSGERVPLEGRLRDASERGITPAAEEGGGADKGSLNNNYPF